jgi:sec-independent protein translocase protein TatB
MFDIGWSELLLIAVVALIVIGPKELPGALRMVGQWMGKLRRMASEFQGQFHEAMREAEMADLKKQVDDMTSQAQSYANFDPVGDIRKEFETTQQQVESTFTAPPPSDPSTMPATTEAATQPPAPPAAEPAPASPEPPATAPATSPAEPLAAGEPAKVDAGGKPA